MVTTALSSRFTPRRATGRNGVTEAQAEPTSVSLSLRPRCARFRSTRLARAAIQRVDTTWTSHSFTRAASSNRRGSPSTRSAPISKPPIIPAKSRVNRRRINMNIEVRGVCALLQVFDMPTSVRFYRDVLGFEVVQTTTPRKGDQFDWGLLRLNDTQLMLNTAYEEDGRPAAPDPARIAAHRDTHLYFSCPDVDGAYRHLQAQGVETEEPHIAPWGSKQLYLRSEERRVGKEC